MANTTASQSLPNSLTENRQSTIYAVIIMFIIIDTLAVILRAVSRRISHVRWVFVDTLIISSWVFTMSFNFLALMQVRFGGVGHHEEYLLKTEPKTVKFFGKMVVGLDIIYLISVILPRLAVLNTYQLIFAHQKEVQIIIYITIALIVANCIGSTIAGCFICIPLEKIWDRFIQGHCFELNSWCQWIRLINILTDAVILLLPLPYIVKLQTSIQVKVGLITTFVLGSLGFIAAIITWVEYFKADIMIDTAWTGSTPLIWNTGEVGTYLIAACLLSYQPLMKLVWRKIFGRAKIAFNHSHPPTVGGTKKRKNKPAYANNWGDDNTAISRTVNEEEEEHGIGLITMTQHINNTHSLRLEEPDQAVVQHPINTQRK